MTDFLTGNGGGPTLNQPVGGGVPGVNNTYPGVTQNPPGTGTVPPIVTPTSLGGGTDWYNWLKLAAQVGLGLYGANNQNNVNSQNFALQKQQLDMLNARQAQVTQGVNSQLQTGQNPYSSLLMQLLGFQFPGAQAQAQTGQPQVNNAGPTGGGGPAPAQTGPGVSGPPPGALRSVAAGGTAPLEGQNRGYADASTPKDTLGVSIPQTQVFHNGQWVNTPGPVSPQDWNWGSNTPTGAYGVTGGTAPTASGAIKASMLGGPSYSMGIDINDVYGPTDTTPSIPNDIFNLTQPASPGTQTGVQTQNPLLQMPFFKPPTPVGTQAMNPGQDPYMQMLRSNTLTQNDIQGTGNPFDTTNLFAALDTKNQRDLAQQVSDLQGSFGSFGERLGSSAYTAQAKLRSDFLTNANAQRQQLAMQAYTDAQNRRLQALGIGAGREGALGSNQLGRDTLTQQGQMFNTTAQQAYNQFLAGGIGQANAMQQAQSGQNAGLLSILAGLPMGQAPVAQTNAYGDIGQLLLLSRFFG